MCGIVGYIGKRPVVDILLDGLEQLEYRGYDSSGIAVKCNDGIKVYKAEGKLKNLREELTPHAYELLMHTRTRVLVANLFLYITVLLKIIKN